ncbi:BatD family protein [Roseibium sp.]|uniref:BatD family protein n=1 Tax=Roseibium sp. TaxID=1936156 RepID=UPI003BAA02EB
MTIVRLLFLVLCLAAAPVWAQDAQIPEIRTSLEQDTAIPGQPLIFRVTVLVPTWLPSPPVFPSYETPNVVVRLPSRASGPTSETINGETWSGVTRSYRLYPMTAGTFQIPPGTIKVTYADPDNQQPVVVDAQTDGFEITGQIPEGAQDLDPFLAAKSLKLERTVEGTPESMEVGDALTITTTVKVTGVAPMFVPPLSDADPGNGLAAYPKEPVLDEKEDRGLLSGTRSEETSLVAETAGTYTIPEKSLSWYNLESGKIETATVPEIFLQVTGTAEAQPEQQATPFDWRGLFGWLVLVALAAVLATVAWRLLSPGVKRSAAALRERYYTSESYLFRQLAAAIRQHDLNGTLQRASRWKTAVGGDIQSGNWRDFEQAVHACSALSFSPAKPNVREDADIRWRHLLETVRGMRQRLRRKRQLQTHAHLPDINPR